MRRSPWSDAAGSFGSPAKDGVDGLLAALGEVFDAFDRLASVPPERRQCRIEQRGKRLWRGAGFGACLVLVAGDIARIAEAVLDAPVLA